MVSSGHSWVQMKTFKGANDLKFQGNARSEKMKVKWEISQRDESHSESNVIDQISM